DTRATTWRGGRLAAAFGIGKPQDENEHDGTSCGVPGPSQSIGGGILACDGSHPAVGVWRRLPAVAHGTGTRSRCRPRRWRLSGRRLRQRLFAGVPGHVGATTAYSSDALRGGLWRPTPCPGATAPSTVRLALLGGERVGVDAPSSVPLCL